MSNPNLNLALSGIRRMIFQDLDGDDLIRPFLPAFNHLQQIKIEYYDDWLQVILCGFKT